MMLGPTVRASSGASADPALAAALAEAAALRKLLAGGTSGSSKAAVSSAARQQIADAVANFRELQKAAIQDLLARDKEAAHAAGLTDKSILASGKKYIADAKASAKAGLKVYEQGEKDTLAYWKDYVNNWIDLSKKWAAQNKADVAKVKSDARSAMSTAASNIKAAYGQLVTDIDAAFSAATDAHITDVLGPQFRQGMQTDLEKQLADMQAADTAKNLSDALAQAQAGGDSAAIAAAQRAIDENNLSIAATADRTAQDKAYAVAVKQWQTDRAQAEKDMNFQLGKLGDSLAKGTGKFIDLQPILDKFGVSMTSIPSDQLASDMSGLSLSVSALSKTLVAEANALAKLGDAPDAAKARAAATAALAGGPVVMKPGSGSAAASLSSTLTGVIDGWINAVPHMATGGAILGTGLAVVQKGERVIPANGGGGGDVHIHVHAPQYVGDHRDLAAALKTPQAQEAISTSLIMASRRGHIRQGDIRP